MKYMTIGLKRKVSLVLFPVDDFTDRVIIGSWLRMYTKEGNVPSIRKPDGYHIFCDLVGSEVEICIEGPLYQKQLLKFPIGQEEPGVYQVRMVPGENYPLPPGAAVVRGVLPPGSAIRLFCPGQKRGYKLLQDYDPHTQGRELSLFQPYEMLLEGKILCMSRKDQNPEFFRVSDQKGEKCILENPLSRAYQKIGTNVYPVSETKATESGSFYLPLNSVTEEVPYVCVLMRAGETDRICEIPLVAGKENRITEDAWKEGE